MLAPGVWLTLKDIRMEEAVEKRIVGTVLGTCDKASRCKSKHVTPYV